MQSTSFFVKYRVALLCSIGNFLELYDYVLYAVLIVPLGKIFFSPLNPEQATTLSMLAFMLSLFLSPLGALFWGWVGDKYGRKSLISNSLFLMAIPSFMMGLLPTYAQAGWIAALFLFICRIGQAFSASGEVQGAKIFAMEHTGPQSYGLVSGMLSCMGGLGVMLAMAMGLLIAQYPEYPNLWRVPFFLASLLGVFGALVRRRFTETPEFQAYKNRQTPPIKLTEIFQPQYRLGAFVVYMLGGFLGMLSYTMHAFMLHWLTSIVGISSAASLRYSILGLGATAMAALAGGCWGDRIGNQKLVQLSLLAALIMAVPTMFIIEHGQSLHLTIGITFLGGLLGLYAACSGVLKFKVFPTAIRCRGMLFFYALGVATWGGVTPLAFSKLAQLNNGSILVGSVLALAACAVWITILVYYTKDRCLE